MRLYRHPIAAALLAVTAAAASPGAYALSYVMMEDEALLAQAEGVARVRVVAVLPSRDGDQETRYRVEIEAALTGAAPGRERILVLPGTFSAPNLNRIVPGVPKLIEGQTYLLFFSERGDGALQAQQLSLGVFGRVPGDTPTYVRYLDEESEVAPSSDKRIYHAARDAAKFERWIADTAKGRAREPDYFIALPEADQAKFTFQSFGFSTPGPGRFFQFDNDQTMSWTALPGGQTGATFDVYNALAQALAAWTNDAGSRILMSYTGTAAQAAYANNACSNASATACFTGFVKWNDPENEITGSFDCNSGGVLGIGGSSAFSSTGTVSGMTWYRRANAFVVVQDNAACSMNSGNGANGAELLAHEIGHSIAFGHSCGDSSSGTCQSGTAAALAIMKASLHGNGRGATLGSDDQAGAAIVYPAPGGSQNIGPTLSAASPASGSTTPMASGSVGATVSSNITFSVSGGSGSGTTTLTCAVASGTVQIASGTPQTISVGGSAAPVVARFTLSSSAQTGVINCTATPQGGSVASFSYTFTAAAGTSTGGGSCTSGVFFRSGFETGENTCR